MRLTILFLSWAFVCPAAFGETPIFQLYEKYGFSREDYEVVLKNRSTADSPWPERNRRALQYLSLIESGRIDKADKLHEAESLLFAAFGLREATVRSLRSHSLVSADLEPKGVLLILLERGRFRKASRLRDAIRLEEDQAQYRIIEELKAGARAAEANLASALRLGATLDPAHLSSGMAARHADYLAQALAAGLPLFRDCGAAFEEVSSKAAAAEAPNGPPD